MAAPTPADPLVPDGARPAIDLRQVMLDIEEEVREKRASGQLAADVERELDLVFARFAPPGTFDGDFETLVAQAEQQAYIDLLAPNTSVRPGVPHVKRLVQKTVRWYLRYIVEQISTFANTLTRAVVYLGDRVSALEQSIPPDEGLPIVVAALRTTAEATWTVAIRDALQGAKGRVLVTRCGDGPLVRSLTEAQIDAYGVDPAAELVAPGSAGGLDLRADDEREHLRSLSASVLDAMVLVAVPDVLLPGAQVELVDLAAVTLKKDGRLVLVASDPERWTAREDVPTDLVAGHPLRTSTWKFLLHDRGFTNIVVTADPAGESYLITATR